MRLRFSIVALFFLLSGCATIAQPGCGKKDDPVYPCHEEDISLVRYWTTEWEEGLISTDEYKWLVRSRIDRLP